MFVELVWLVPLLPFVAFLAILALRNRMPGNGSYVALIATLGSLVVSAGMLWEILGGRADYETSLEWMRVGTNTFEMGFLVDELSAFMAALVSLLSSLIVLFSFAYMAAEGKRLPRYYAEMTLFIAGMLGTVLADNYLLMFVSWELMGLCSYLLIGFWFERPKAASAAKKAFLVTRVGDISLILGMIVLYRVFGTFSYRAIFENQVAIDANAGLLSLAALLILGGAVGKSAQFPLHVWLPDAMEGPTTVSALIHAATMVKAGVFLVGRSFPLFVHTPDVFLWVGLLGGLTAFMAATMALVQFDIKRVLAYSTLSQIGYMFLALGAGGSIAVALGSSAGYTAAFFHLMNHGFIKALLFLGAGSVLLGLHHHNDLRMMGGLGKKMPLTSATMLIGCLSIAGIPPLSGFWSKDEVLAAAQEAGGHAPLYTLLWLLALATAVLTAFYMFRMWFMTFAGSPRSEAAEHAHESPRVMTVPLVLLSVFAVLAGFYLFAGFTDLIHFEVGEWITGAPSEEAHGGTTLLLSILVSPWTWIATILALGGLGLAFVMYKARRLDPARITSVPPGSDIHKLLTNLYYYDAAFMRTGEAVGLGLARASNAFDQAVIDGAVRGVGFASQRAGRTSTRWQTGRITTYAASVITGVTLVLFSIIYLADVLGGVF